MDDITTKVLTNGYESDNEKKFLTASVKIGDSTFDVLSDSGLAAGVHHSSYNPHSHASHEIYFIKRGALSLICNGKNIDLSEGDIFVIRAHTPHHITGCSNDVERFNLRFLIHSHEYSDTIPKPYIMYTTEPKERKEIMDSIGHIRTILTSEIGKAQLYRLKSHYGIIFSHALEFFCANNRMAEPGHYSRLTTYTRIDTYFTVHYGEPITLESLAEYLSYSKAQTNRILHEYCGKSFSQVLRDTRLVIAKRLLAESTLTISEIAAKCGYDTRQGFEMMFIKYAGITPHAYRDANSIVRQSYDM